ncbi:uncharacterized protein FFB20_08284 [Fusarium fujikuroi]|nr:uncharacterized protein FFB20_08284 [Fusarium fujikuroi]SCO08804.1 uncharacterized protein FFE2_11666 [Fusarium fujikuroi]SCV53982.1 uncharacterized protein FFFS_11038 [Fusarium fujikuroi]
MATAAGQEAEVLSIVNLNTAVASIPDRGKVM